MTKTRRNRIVRTYKTSLNAMSQALKYVYGLNRNQPFETLCLPHTYTAHNRYWSNSYNIKPWKDRTVTEVSRAKAAAMHILLFGLASLGQKVQGNIQLTLRHVAANKERNNHGREDSVQGLRRRRRVCRD